MDRSIVGSPENCTSSHFYFTTAAIFLKRVAPMIVISATLSMIPWTGTPWMATLAQCVTTMVIDSGYT